ncbi:hypothetical protein OSCI_3790022 [Kamptonema sp. PCC 6506]|nr:hypothetical protein OSCI_3790022 [Kamptonema sp. PCC 6506]
MLPTWEKVIVICNYFESKLKPKETICQCQLSVAPLLSIVQQAQINRNH